MYVCAVSVHYVAQCTSYLAITLFFEIFCIFIHIYTCGGLWRCIHGAIKTITHIACHGDVFMVH